jgi:hypothetical protein
MYAEENGEISMVGLPVIIIVAFLPLSSPIMSACRCSSTQWKHPVCSIYAAALTLFYGFVNHVPSLPIPALLDIAFISEAANHFYGILVLSLIARSPPS